MMEWCQGLKEDIYEKHVLRMPGSEQMRGKASGQPADSGK